MSEIDVERLKRDAKLREACERSWMTAHRNLLEEWASFTDKERKRFKRRYDALFHSLDQLVEEWDDYSDAVVIEGAHYAKLNDVVRDELEQFVDTYVCTVQIVDDSDPARWRWVALPDVNIHRTQDGVTEFMRRVGNTLLLVRSFPTAWVGEVRNVPKGHPALETMEVFTLEDQENAEWPIPVNDPQPIDVGAGGDWAGVPTPSVNE